MTNQNMVFIAMFGIACVTLMIVTATLMGHNGGLVAGAVGTITSAIGAILGIDLGGKKKERSLRRDLDLYSLQLAEAENAKSQRLTNEG